MRVAHFAILLLFLLTSHAHARCEGAVVLATLHDAYQTTVNGPREAQKRAATTLLVLVGSQTGEKLSEQVARAGVDVNASRLRDALEDARNLASSTLNGRRSTDTDFRHSLNLEWLAELVAATRCKSSASNASFTPTTDPHARARIQAIGSSHPATPDGTSTWVYHVAIAMIVGLGGGGLLLRKSVFMRRRQMERMPRFPISLMLELTYTDPDGEMREAGGEAVDISQGGMKLKWDTPPPQGTLTTLTLLGIQRLCHVIWANPHYAGLMFDDRLTPAELKSLKETHAPL